MSGPAAQHVVAFTPYQLRWIESFAPVELWRKSRRIGADYCDAFKRVSRIMRGVRSLDVNYAANKLENARQYIEYVQHFARLFGDAIEYTTGEEVVNGENLLTYRVVFPPNKSRRAVTIRAMSSNPSAARGFDGDFVLSELAWHPDPEEMFAAASPCTALGGQISMLSSVNEAGDYFDQLSDLGRKLIDPETHGQLREDDMRIAFFQTTIHDAVSDGHGSGKGFIEIINRTRGTTFTPESYIESIRQKTDRSKFPREYECKSDTDSDSYFPWALLRPAINQHLAVPMDLTRPAGEDSVAFDAIWSERGAEQVRELLAGLADPGVGGRLYAGIDVGRTRDKFAIVVGRKIGQRVAAIGTLRWRGMKFIDMQAAGDALMRWRSGDSKITRLVSDRTGLGMQMAEHWEDTFRRRVEGIDFSNTNKEVLATHTRSMFEMALVSIPEDRELCSQINSIRETRTATGRPRYDGERTADGHADGFWALAAMLHAADTSVSQARVVPCAGGVA